MITMIMVITKLAYLQGPYAGVDPLTIVFGDDIIDDNNGVIDINHDNEANKIPSWPMCWSGPTDRPHCQGHKPSPLINRTISD